MIKVSKQDCWISSKADETAAQPRRLMKQNKDQRQKSGVVLMRRSHVFPVFSISLFLLAQTRRNVEKHDRHLLAGSQLRSHRRRRRRHGRPPLLHHHSWPGHNAQRTNNHPATTREIPPLVYPRQTIELLQRPTDNHGRRDPIRWARKAGHYGSISFLHHLDARPLVDCNASLCPFSARARVQTGLGIAVDTPVLDVGQSSVKLRVRGYHSPGYNEEYACYNASEMCMGISEARHGW